MSLDHQMEQHRLAVEVFNEKCSKFDEKVKVFDEKEKAFDESKADYDARVAQFEEAAEKYRITVNRYDKVLVAAERLLDEVNLQRGCKGDFHNVLHEHLIDLKKAMDNGN